MCSPPLIAPENDVVIWHYFREVLKYLKEMILIACPPSLTINFFWQTALYCTLPVFPQALT